MARIPPRPTSGPVCITRYSAAQPQGGRSNVTLVTDATAAFGSDGMKTTASNAAMFTDAAEALMSRLPTRNG
jgi:nicotinamidase-related amidase